MRALIITLAWIWSSTLLAIDIHHEQGTSHFSSTPTRVITLDWALTETVLSLGVTPIAVADTTGYKNWVSIPTLPSSSMDLGSRSEPNLERIARLKPDVIFINQSLKAIYEALNKIAPTVMLSTYNSTKSPYLNAQAITKKIGTLLGKTTQAEQLITQTKQALQQNGDTIQRHNKNQKPLLFIRFLNASTLRVHGEGSLLQATLNQMQLTNDWQQKTNDWGFSSTPIETLAAHQGAYVMIFGPLKEDEKQALTNSPLWQAMAFTKTQSVSLLPTIWTFGGLISAQRLSDAITLQLTSAKATSL